MLRFNKAKIVKVKFFGAKKPTQIWDVNADNIVVSKLSQS